MIHATKLLSEFAYGLRYSSLPAEVVETTKRFIIDYYAAAVAGMKINSSFNNAVEQLMLEMSGKPECDYLLSDNRLPCANAAFLSACYAHGADMDDGNRKAMGHVGAHVISAVLTLAQTLDCSGKDVIVAINVGYEVYNRVAAAVQPGLVHRGFHSTGTAGAIACGAACAKLMGMDSDGIYNTMALCAIQASGLIIIAESGQQCKPINPANAAKTGIISAKLIKSGIKSSVFPLESKKGYFHAMSDDVDEAMITDGLGTKFTICESYMKPYPSCRHTHCGIDAILYIRKKLPAGAKIKSINVYIYPNAIRIAGQILKPENNDSAKFSIHYSLAVALLRGHFNLDDLDVSENKVEVDGIIDLITLIDDESMEKRDEGIRGAKVSVILEDGQEFEKTVLIPKGDPANPFTQDDLIEKMNGCCKGILDEEQQRKLIGNILKLETTERFNSINLYK